MLREGLLHQFSLAKEQVDRAENVEVDDVVAGELVLHHVEDLPRRSHAIATPRKPKVVNECVFSIEAYDPIPTLISAALLTWSTACTLLIVHHLMILLPLS